MESANELVYVMDDDSRVREHCLGCCVQTEGMSRHSAPAAGFWTHRIGMSFHV